MRLRDRYTNLIAAALFMPLVLPAEEGDGWTGGLASRLELEGRALRIVLDPRFRWDEEHGVTAEDLLAAWRRKLAGASASDLFWIEGAECVAEGRCAADSLAVELDGEHTLRVRTVAEASMVPSLLMLTNFSPVPSFLSDEELEGAWWRRWSYGPYRIVSWTEEGFELEAHPHSPEPPRTRAWRGVFSRDGDYSVTLFKEGRADWVISPVPVGAVKRLRAELGEAVFTEPMRCVFGFFTRTLDADTRERLFCAVDREAVSIQMLGAGQRPAFDVIPDSFGRGLASATRGCDRVRGRPPLDGGALAKVRALCNTEGGSDRVCSFILESAREAGGIRYELSSTEWRTMFEVWRQEKHELLRYSLCGTADPLSFLEAFTSGNEENLSGFEDEVFERALAQIREGGAEKLAGLERARARLREALPFIPVYQHSLMMLVRPGAEGISAHPAAVHPLQRVKLP